MVLPYGLALSDTSLSRILTSEMEELTGSLLTLYPAASLTMEIRMHILQLHLDVSRTVEGQVTVDHHVPRTGKEAPSLMLQGDLRGYIEYTLTFFGCDQETVSDAVRATLETLVRRSLFVVFLREQLMFSSLVHKNQHTALIVFDNLSRIMFVNRDGDHLLSEQTQDVLALPLGRERFIPFLSYLSGLKPARRVQKVYLTNGKQYHIHVQALEDPLMGPLRLVILHELLPVDTEAVMGHLITVGLTPRERDVAALLLRGMKNQQIAQSLGISVLTVKDHLTHMFKKVKVSSRNEFICTLIGVE